MNSIRAIYENGVFRPTEPVEIPENCAVILHAELDVESAEKDLKDNAAIWSVLCQPVESGDSWLSERHNEHQP
jgi:predicted DNA-binding antitoxin AbrB/MazE fold protein